MSRACWACQANVGIDAAFCSSCGASLDAPSASVESLVSNPAPTLEPTSGHQDVSHSGTVETGSRSGRFAVFAGLAVAALVGWLLLAGGNDTDPPAASSTTLPSNVQPSTALPSTALPSTALSPGSTANQPGATAAAAAFDSEVWTAGPTFGPNASGVGQSLVALVADELLVVDLASGQSEAFALPAVRSTFGSLSAVEQVGDQLVVVSNGSTVAFSTSSGEVIELGRATLLAVADPVYTGGVPAVWLGSYGENQRGVFRQEITWRLVALDGTELRTLEADPVLLLPSFGPEMDWEPGGGVFSLVLDREPGDDEPSNPLQARYQRVRDGFPWAYNDLGVLARVCDEARRCVSNWISRDGRLLDLPVPDAPFSFVMSASNDGRRYYVADGQGEVYDTDSASQRSLNCEQHDWPVSGPLFACADPAGITVFNFETEESSRYELDERVVGVALIPADQ